MEKAVVFMSNAAPMMLLLVTGAFDIVRGPLRLGLRTRSLRSAI
jgi:hypothetical protein